MPDSHPFDTIVQAANPAHPDHSAWVERFGTSSRSHRSSNAGSTHKSDNFANLRREAEQRGKGGGGIDAEAVVVAQDEDGQTRGSRSPSGSRRPSLHSASAASGTPKRKKRRDKGKGRAPAPPIPPPRTTSVLATAAHASPSQTSPTAYAAPAEPSLIASGLPENSRLDTTLVGMEVGESVSRSGATSPSDTRSTSSKHRKKQRAPRVPLEPPEPAPRKSSFSAEREPHQTAYTSTRGWQDMPPLPAQALGNIQAHPREEDRSPTASAGHSRISFDIPSGSARHNSPSTKAVSFNDPQARDGGSSVRRSLDSVLAPFGMGRAQRAREEEAAKQVIKRMSATRTADGYPASILTNGSSSRVSLDSTGPNSSMRGILLGASDSSMHGHGSVSSPTSATGPSASPGASPLIRPPRRVGGMHLMPVGPSTSTGGRPLSSVHDVRESGTEGEENFVDARSEEEGGLGSDAEEAKRKKAALASAQTLRKRSSASSPVAERKRSLENGHAAARAARQAALERQAHDLPPLPKRANGGPEVAPGREMVFSLLKHDSDSSAEEEAVDLKGTPIGGTGAVFGSPAAGSLRKRSGSRASAKDSLRGQHASPSIDSLPHPPRAATSMGSYEVRRKRSAGLKSNTSSSNLSVTPSLATGASHTTEDRRERLQSNQYYIPPSFSQPSMPARSMARSGSAMAMATTQSEGFLPQGPALDQNSRSISQPIYGYATGSPAPQSQLCTPSWASQQRFQARPDAQEANPQLTPTTADPRPAPPSKSPSSRGIASFFSRSKPGPPPAPPAVPQQLPFPAGGEPMAPLASGSTGSTLLTNSDAHFPSVSPSPQHTLVEHADGSGNMAQAHMEAGVPLPARPAIGLGIGATMTTSSSENLESMLIGRPQMGSPVVKPNKVNGSGGWRQRVASFSKNSPKGQQLQQQQQALSQQQQVPELPTPNDAQWRHHVPGEAVGSGGRRGNDQQQRPSSPVMDRSIGSIEGSGTSSTRPSLDLQRLLGRGGRNKESQGSPGDSLGVANGETIHKSLSPAMLDSWTHEADDIDSVIGSLGEEMEELDMAAPEASLSRGGANGDFSDSEHGRLSTDVSTTFDTGTDGGSTADRSHFTGGHRSLSSSMDHDLPDPPIKLRLMRPSVEMTGNSSDAGQTLVGHQRAASAGVRGVPDLARAPPVATTGSFTEKMKAKRSIPPAALSLDSSTSAVAALKAATSSTTDLHEQRGRMNRGDSQDLSRLEEESPRSAGLASNRNGFTSALGNWRPKQRSDSTSTRASAFTTGANGGPPTPIGYVGGSPMMSPSVSAPGSDGASPSSLRSPGFLSAFRKAAAGAGKRKGGTPGSSSSSVFPSLTAKGGISSADFAFEEQEFMAGDDERVRPAVQALGNGFTGGPAYGHGVANGNDSLEAARAATDLLAVQSETMPLTPSSYGGNGSSAPATPGAGAARSRLGSSSANQRPTAWYQPADGSGSSYVMTGSEPWPGSGGAGSGAISSSDDLPSMAGFRDGRHRTQSSMSGIGATGGSKAATSSTSLAASLSAPGGAASPSVRSPDLTMFGQMLARAQAEDAARIKGIAARAVAGGSSPSVAAAGSSSSSSSRQPRQGSAITAAR